MSILEEFPRTSPEIAALFEARKEQAEETKAEVDRAPEMADETSTTEAPIVETKAPEYSEAEKAAIAQGWDPTGEKAKAAGKEHLSAAEFLRRGELFERIDHQKKEINELKKDLHAVVDVYKKAEEIAYQRALTDLNAKREAAIKDGDLNAFHKIDAEITETYKKQAAVEAIKPTSKVENTPKPLSSEEQEFADRNKFWLNPADPQNALMVAEATDLDLKLAQYSPNMSVKDRLKIIEGEIQRRFPHRFENSKRSEPAPVVIASKDSIGGSSSKDDTKLTSEQKRAAQMFHKNGVYKTLAESEKAVREIAKRSK